MQCASIVIITYYISNNSIFNIFIFLKTTGICLKLNGLFVEYVISQSANFYKNNIIHVAMKYVRNTFLDIFCMAILRNNQLHEAIHDLSSFQRTLINDKTCVYVQYNRSL